MKIVVTGCTGHVGREIVPILIASKAMIILIGRDVEKINRLFPGVLAGTYSDLPDIAEDFDILIHLAVLNNDEAAPLDEFRRINVGFMLEVASAGRAAGIGRFLHFSTFHALDENNSSYYAQSKREAMAALRSADVNDTTLIIPAVYGERWSGKLAPLNTMPNWLRKCCFAVISSLQPVTSSRKISDYIIERSLIENEREVFIFDDKSENTTFNFLKRSLDLIFAVIATAVLWWLLAILWVCVRIQSRGPGIFAQTRVGLNGRSFTCYKFRTMAQGTRQAGTHEVSASAVTNIGRFLRRTKLDELPQIWNIFRNEVSLIGPRPCLPNQLELIAYREKYGILKMKPGITGFAQINDVDMSDPERLTRFDYMYKARRGLFLEAKILLATITGRGQGDRTRV